MKGLGLTDHLDKTHVLIVSTKCRRRSAISGPGKREEMGLKRRAESPPLGCLVALSQEASQLLVPTQGNSFSSQGSLELVGLSSKNPCLVEDGKGLM